MKVILLIITALTLTGCAGTYPNEIRITQYGTAGQYIPFVDAQIGGVAVYKKGSMKGITVTYTDRDKINVTVTGD